MPPCVVVAGVYSYPHGSVLPPSGGEEYVVLVNLGDAPADLRGWQVTNRKSDCSDHYRYLMPRFLSDGEPWALEPGGLAFLHTGRGRNVARGSTGDARQYHLYQHREVRVWQDAGDTVCLYDRRGSLVSCMPLPEHCLDP